MIDPIDRDKGRVPSIQEVADKVNDLIIICSKLYELSQIHQVIIDRLVDMHQSVDPEDLIKEIKEKAN